eukprot:scaffold3498_cov112-Isochrysis_galbana.AAC.5
MASIPSRRDRAASLSWCVLPYHCSTVPTVHLPSAWAIFSLSYLRDGKGGVEVSRRPHPAQHTRGAIAGGGGGAMSGLKRRGVTRLSFEGHRCEGGRRLHRPGQI